jgi:hypothetical protein
VIAAEHIEQHRCFPPRARVQHEGGLLFDAHHLKICLRIVAGKDGLRAACAQELEFTCG